MTIRENIFADFEDALIKAESSLEFISVTEDSKFGYRRLEVDITHVEGMDIESGCFSRRERSYLEKTLESITKYSTQFNADGDEESYYCVDYRILDRRGREITPAIRYTYNWFAGGWEKDETPSSLDETEKFKTRLADFLARTIALQLRRCPYSHSEVYHEYNSDDNCYFSINIGLGEDESYSEKDVTDIIKTIPVAIADEFLFEIWVEKDGKIQDADDFRFRFSQGTWERIHHNDEE